MFRLYRERAGLNQEGAAGQLGISARQLQRYEAGANVPEDMVLRMAVVYRAPELIIAHVDNSPVHDQLGELHLTGINKNPVAVLVKYVEEINEAAVASQGLMRMVFNLGQVPDKERPAIVALMEQSFYDVKTALARAEISMLEITGVEAGIEARRRHKEKCMARGYLRKEKQPALVAEQQAEYLIS